MLEIYSKLAVLFQLHLKKTKNKSWNSDLMLTIFCSNSLKTILMAMTKMKQEKFLINLYQFLIWILIKASCNVYNYKQMSQNFVSFEIWTEWLWYLNIDQILILKNYRCTDSTIQMTKHHRNPFNPCLNSNRSQVSRTWGLRLKN